MDWILWIVIYISITGISVFWIDRWLKKKSKNYRLVRRYVDRVATGFHNFEDGMPGGNRGKVWTDKERENHRKKRKLNAIHIQSTLW